MRRSSVSVAVLSALIVLLPASAASAHAVFVGAPNGFPANSEQTLTLNVPHERGEAPYNVAVSVRIPASWTALSCQSKPTWTCAIELVGGRQVFRFTKNAGSEVAEDETFQFGVRTASTAGTFPFETVQTYNTGEVVSWIGAAGTSNPAPMLATLPGGTAPQTTPSTTNPDAPPTTAPIVTAPTTTGVSTTNAPTTTVAPTTTAGSATSTTLASTTTASPSSSTTTTLATDASPDDDDDSSSAPLIVGLVVLVAAAAAGGYLVYRRQSQSR